MTPHRGLVLRLQTTYRGLFHFYVLLPTYLVLRDSRTVLRDHQDTLGRLVDKPFSQYTPVVSDGHVYVELHVVAY